SCADAAPHACTRAGAATARRGRGGRPGAALPAVTDSGIRFHAVEPIRVVARRSGTGESDHRAHAVAVREGRVVAATGDSDLVTYFRSSAKPLQALALARAHDDLEYAELAIACASHP